jgi:hypothetical protein
MEREPAKMVVWVALLLALSASCDGSQGDATAPPPGDRAELVIPGPPVGGGVTVQLPAKKEQSYVHGSFPVCLDKPGEVKVTSVEFKSGKAKITGWALRPTPESEFAGDRPGATLASRHIENTDVLTRVCDNQGNSYELVLQLRAGTSNTDGDGVVVRYTSDGDEGSLELPDRVVLCVQPGGPPCLDNL